MGVFLVFVHADFIGVQETMDKLIQAGFLPSILGKRGKKLQETVLTKLLKSRIEKSGYKFRENKEGEEYFELVVFSGKKK